MLAHRSLDGRDPFRAIGPEREENGIAGQAVRPLLAKIANGFRNNQRVSTSLTRMGLRLATLLCLLLAVPQPVFAQVFGFVDCVTFDEDTQTVTAFFGYINATQNTIVLSAGDLQNFFVPAPPARPGQVENFLPGEHHFVFSTTFHPDDDVIWVLQQNAVLATENFASCAVPVDHYQCYEAKEKAGPGSQIVDLEDQFGWAGEVQVRKPRLLCAPVDKNGEGVSNPDTHLVCYDLQSRPRPKEDVLVENQFGEQILEIGKAGLLCVPSTE